MINQNNKHEGLIASLRELKTERNKSNFDLTPSQYDEYLLAQEKRVNEIINKLNFNMMDYPAAENLKNTI